MKKITLPALLIWALFTFQPAMADDEPQYSGFLGGDDVYARLQKAEVGEDGEAWRWIGPRLNIISYKAVLIDDVVLYPAPEPNEQVSAETLERISEYMTSTLKERVGAVVTLTDEPGVQVVRMQAAITAVEIKTEGMKAYEVVPVAAVFGLAKAATGTRDRDVFVRGEIKMVDSVSGELVGAFMRRIEGKQLDGKRDILELEDVQGNLDEAIGEGSKIVDEVFSENE